jgi:DnaJ-class molecular chaperone
MIKLKSLLLELLSPTDAAEIFRRFGVDNALTISKDELKAKYKELVLKHHPDKGGDTYNAQMINAAYDILKNHNISPSYRGNNSGGSSFNEKNINFNIHFGIGTVSIFVVFLSYMQQLKKHLKYHR